MTRYLVVSQYSHAAGETRSQYELRLRWEWSRAAVQPLRITEASSVYPPLVNTVRREAMMTGGTHNCWRHTVSNVIQEKNRPWNTPCKTTNLLCFVVIQIILFLLISEVPPHATDYLPNFP